ncbi:ExbD/TolR family protein [Ramlibacter albus]|uniref:Biopolymer transporter ExbD n=1 Tax=Ramlibacter albus TaxID=2079448 RepID=A0A923M7I9_9BURK|nr:biopolymer transporter ExbD [Ramlibacter albus]MBC5764323.1 biopolymer transporter ExbD [Ramlibacter albus]
MALRKRRFGQGDDEVMMDINTTPLIDVMLVLLVMLIITIPIQLHAVNLEMPVGTPPTNQEPEKIQIDIDEKSTVYWQGLPVDAATLETNMDAIAQRNPQPVVAVRPNKEASYAVFANVLATSKRKGLSKMTVLGAEQFVQ